MVNLLYAEIVVAWAAFVAKELVGYMASRNAELCRWSPYLSGLEGCEIVCSRVRVLILGDSVCSGCSKFGAPGKSALVTGSLLTSVYTSA